MDIKQKIFNEIKKCISDPFYFTQNYLYIQHPIKGRVKFEMYDFQKKTLENIVNNRFTVILKARQMGISTLMAAYTLWFILFHKDKNVLIVATKLGVAQNLMTKIRIMYENLPNWFKTLYPLRKNNETEMVFENGSRVVSAPMTDTTGRSEALSLLIVDEAAFIRNIDDLWTSIFPTLSTGGRAVILSTPNGTGNFFHKLYVNAENSENNFFPIKLHWTLHPERNEQWYKQTLKDIGHRRFAQEYDCDFLTSGNTFIDIEILNNIETKDPVEKRGINKEYWIWEYPQMGKDYIVSVDIARGDGSDYSAIQVLDIKDIIQVAEFKGKIPTTQLANISVSIATEYNNALLVIENTGIGWSVIQKVIELGYKNIYYSNKKNTSVVDPEVFISNNYDLLDKSHLVPGLTTSAKSRPIILSKLEMYFRENEITINSKRLLDELKVFIWEKGKPQAQKGYNDDLIMALSFALFVRDIAVIFSQKGLEITKITLNKTVETLSKIRNIKNNQNTNPFIVKQKNIDIDLREWI